MAWRVVSIANPARLSFSQGQLHVAQEETATVPLEDIDTLLIDSHGVTLTANLLAELSKAKVTVIFCDEKHLPVSNLLPYEPNSRQAKTVNAQLSMAQPLKKRIWRRIVCQKITNQAAAMRVMGYPHDQLLQIIPLVKSGDTSNQEAYAAQLYFRHVLEGATRQTPIWHNAALNYGYAIVRSVLARNIASYGLLSSQGIHHRSELNNFNLADDLIEPYRAIVDLYVMTIVGRGRLWEHPLTKPERALILDILNNYVIIQGKRQTLKYALELTVSSLVSCISTKDDTRIVLPELTKFAPPNGIPIHENNGFVRPSDDFESREEVLYEIS